MRGFCFRIGLTAMFFFKKKPKEVISPRDESADPRSIESTLKNDLIGVDDFKQSKLGFITGSSAVHRAVSSFNNSISETGSRLKGLYRTSTATERDVLELDDSVASTDAKERFQQSMGLHQLREADLARILRNTSRQGWSYLTLAFVSVAISGWTYAMWPPSGAYSAIIRLGPLPLIAALVFKCLYTNWIVRKRALAPPMEFLKSFEWLPKTKFNK